MAVSPAAGRQNSRGSTLYPGFAAIFLASLFSPSSPLSPRSDLSLRTPPPLPVPPLPTASQLAWQLGEMAMFLHFGPNTFTDSEWGTGRADPSVFHPPALNARQWARAAADSGFSRVVLTAKHHDGFCLWPSAYTDYSVLSSPWKDGQGDVVAELAAAAAEFGIGMGIYLSPWDRHERSYGKSAEYNEYYLGQMTELLTGYGEIKEVFLDGAKGKNATDMNYLFDCWFDVIHQYQPEAVIFSDAGPDSRWVGNEVGAAGRTCWSLFNQSTAYIGHTDEWYSSQGDPDGNKWIPAECDVSIRPGWFWHEAEHPKPAIELLDIYYKSVGRNCFLILNVPPNSSGLISNEDLQVLQEFSKLRKDIFSNNLAEDAIITASSMRGGSNDRSFGAVQILKEGLWTYWAPEEGQPHWAIHLDLQRSVEFNVLQVQEPIQMGQRISEFHLDAVIEGEWQTVMYGTTVGYKRLLKFPVVRSRYLRLVVDGSRADPLISFLGIHLDESLPFHAAFNASTSTSSNGTQLIRLPGCKANRGRAIL